MKISRNELKKWFQGKQILWNDQALSPSTELRPGQHKIQILIQNQPSHQSIQSKNGSFLSILYQDQDLLILDKKSGIPSAPHSPSETETAVGSASALFPQLLGVGDHPLEPGLIHRLDTGTSGALVFAKNQTEFKRLKWIWKNRQIEKTYRAIVIQNKVLPLPLKIDFQLAHHSKSNKKMIALTDSKMIHYRGQPIPARTHVLSSVRIQALCKSDSLADLTLQIETGVMHQIRCHLQACDMPIWGDPIYGAKHHPETAERMWLHAWKLKFPLQSGQTLEIEAPLPFNWPC
jgi:23S rRNA pseudouridine1911/1915/1917 synthase